MLDCFLFSSNHSIDVSPSSKIFATSMHASAGENFRPWELLQQTSHHALELLRGRARSREWCRSCQPPRLALYFSMLVVKNSAGLTQM